MHALTRAKLTISEQQVRVFHPMASLHWDRLMKDGQSHWFLIEDYRFFSVEDLIEKWNKAMPNKYTSLFYPF